jgi:hypothetical protein
MMAAVFDQIEATVDPDTGSSPGGAQPEPKKGPHPFDVDRMEAELLRVERRFARLRAD